MNVAFMLHNYYQPKKGLNLTTSGVIENSFKKTKSDIQKCQSATLSRVSSIRYWGLQRETTFRSLLIQLWLPVTHTFIIFIS